MVSVPANLNTESSSRKREPVTFLARRPDQALEVGRRAFADALVDLGKHGERVNKILFASHRIATF